MVVTPSNQTIVTSNETVVEPSNQTFPVIPLPFNATSIPISGNASGIPISENASVPIVFNLPVGCQQSDVNGMCLMCNQQSVLSNGSCQCAFNFTIFVSNSTAAQNQSTNATSNNTSNTYDYGIDNYISFSSDIPNDNTVFNCSDLLAIAMSEATSNTLLQDVMKSKFAGLQCLVSNYYYIMYNQASPVDKLSILNIPDDMHQAFVN